VFARFSQQRKRGLARPSLLISIWIPLKAPSGAGFAGIAGRVCTISGHGVVDGLHSIEKTSSYEC
jgi:hypothetical protein